MSSNGDAKGRMAGGEHVKDMKICIIGAGMGGLTAALALAKRGFSNLEVYETASNLGFVGAGIQLAPNMARVLENLGVWADVAKDAVVVEETSIREGKNDHELGHVVLDDVKSKYGYAHAVGHRSSLAGALYAGCKRESGIKFIFGTSITAVYDFDRKPRFRATPRDGSAPYDVTADLLIAADGVKSLIRERMLEELSVEAQVQETGQAAYRIMLTREQLQDDAELLTLLDSNTVTRWVGVKKHLIAYPVSGKSIYNISTIQPDTNFAAAPSATYTTRGSKKAMLDVFAEFCPRVQRLLDLVPEGEVCEWRLRMHSKLPTWVHGSVALVGDACHPTLPHLAQGAAQAIEDGAVLAVALAALPDTKPESLIWALRSYEQVRKERAETLVELAAASGRALHLDESDAKAERDRQFAALKEGKGPVPDKWADGEVLQMINGFDCVQVTEALMAQGGAIR